MFVCFFWLNISPGSSGQVQPTYSVTVRCYFHIRTTSDAQRKSYPAASQHWRAQMWKYMRRPSVLYFCGFSLQDAVTSVTVFFYDNRLQQYLCWTVLVSPCSTCGHLEFTSPSECLTFSTDSSFLWFYSSLSLICQCACQPCVSVSSYFTT